MLPRPEVRDIINIFLLLAIVGMAVYILRQEDRILARLEPASNPVITEGVPPVETPAETPKPPTEPRNRHAQAISTIEADAGMRLSRIAELIIRDEGKRKHPYPDKNGTPTIGVGRNLRDNGISVIELQAIIDDIDYDVVLKETHVKNGRIRIGSLDLANRIFPNPLTEHDIGLLLTDDLNNVRREAVSVFGQSVWDSIDGVRKEAILDTIFNLGLPHFKTFVNFIAAVKRGDWDTAATELLLSEAARENILRYHRNATVLRTGDKRYFDL